ncbi:hypothetical protein C8R45DRAFT_1090654 [Mycena sanguinolenta]|nr:hypothetical protein C8R45DRAFT_1090654 [Mycena sanguinolenta]
MLTPALVSSLIVHAFALSYFLIIPVTAHRLANDSHPQHATFALTSQPRSEHGLTTSHIYRLALTLSDVLLACHWTGYNTGVQPMKNPTLIIVKSLHVHGFIVSTLTPKYDAAFKVEVLPKLASGEFKFTEDVTHGLDKVGDALLAVLKGTNTGKAIVHVADE